MLSLFKITVGMLHDIVTLGPVLVAPGGVCMCIVLGPLQQNLTCGGAGPEESSVVVEGIVDFRAAE